MIRSKGLATNSRLGDQLQIGTFFCIVSANVVKKSLMFLHRVNNIEHNIKQNVYTGMKVISLRLPWYCMNSKIESVLINNTSNL